MSQFGTKIVLDDHGAPENTRLEYIVYRQLLERIHTGIYALGHKLPTENELAEEFKVSRPVIRSALARLRDDSLIVSRRGAGSYVDNGKYRNTQGFTPLRSIEDISAYWAFRSLIESQAASLAATLRSEKQMKQLRQVHEELGQAIAREISTVELNTQLHLVIGEMAGNHFFNDTLKLLTPHMDFVGNFLRSFSNETYRRNKGTMHNEHAAIVDAIGAQDADAARTAMIVHIETSERRVFKGR